MGEYDITIKYFSDKYPAPYIALALGPFDGAYRLLNKKLPAVETEADFLAMVESGGQTFILHIEYQTRYDAEMLFRMLDYRVRIRKQYGKPVYSIVVWLTDEGYPGPEHNELIESVWGEEQLVFRYSEIRLWELSPEDFLSRGDFALLPLIPLMGSAPSQKVLKRVVEAANRIDDDAIRPDLHTAISILGSLRHERGFIASLIKEEMMKESPIFREIMQKGAVQAVREDIVEVLTTRLSNVHEGVINALNEIEDIDELKRLVSEAARCQSMDEFLQKMPAPQSH